MEMCSSVFCNLDKLYRNYEFICAIDVGDDHLVESKISMHAFVFTFPFMLLSELSCNLCYCKHHIFGASTGKHHFLSPKDLTEKTTAQTS